MSEVWKYFKKFENTAQCNICLKKPSMKGGSTSGLKRHLTFVHNIKLDNKETHANNNEIVRNNDETVSNNNENVSNSNEIPRKNNDSNANNNVPASNKGASAKQSSISKFIITKTMPEIVSKLAAVDGMSIRTITKSSFIRESFAARNMTLPKNETDVKNIVVKYYKTVKEAMVKNINSEICKNGRFTLILDEWTSVAQKRYLNICLHGGDSFFNLGLVLIPGRSSASEIRIIIETRLTEFNLCFENHIVATVSDGPNVMKRFVTESPVDGFFCWNHAIHLAVIEVLYVKSSLLYSESESELSEDDLECETHVVKGKFKLYFYF